MKRLAPAVLLLAVVIAGCGSTRFVMVQNQAGGGAAAPATTAAPAGPTSEDDLAAVKEVVGVALSTDAAVTFEDRLPYLVDADDIGPTVDAIRDLFGRIEVGLTVDDVTVAGDDATVTVSVTSGGEAFASGVPVAMVRVDGTWKITRDGACAVLSLGSPCPER